MDCGLEILFPNMRNKGFLEKLFPGLGQEIYKGSSGYGILSDIKDYEGHVQRIQEPTGGDLYWPKMREKLCFKQYNSCNH